MIIYESINIFNYTSQTKIGSGWDYHLQLQHSWAVSIFGTKPNTAKKSMRVCVLGDVPNGAVPMKHMDKDCNDQFKRKDLREDIHSLKIFQHIETLPFKHSKCLQKKEDLEKKMKESEGE